MTTAWPPKADQILKSGWESGLSARQIANELGISGFRKSRNAVIARKHRLKLPKRKSDCKYNPVWSKTVRSSRPKPIVFIPPKAMPRDVILSSLKKPSSAKSLTELNNNECRFPYGENNFKFCGKPTDGGSYCTHHQQICRTRGK